MKTVFVVAEAPMRTMGFVDACHDRIAGFVFNVESNAEEGQSSAVNITYVESCLYDLDTLDHDEKDALLEDRALIVHRLLSRSRHTKFVAGSIIAAAPTCSEARGNFLAASQDSIVHDDYSQGRSSIPPGQTQFALPRVR